MPLSFLYFQGAVMYAGSGSRDPYSPHKGEILVQSDLHLVQRNIYSLCQWQPGKISSSVCQSRILASQGNSVKSGRLWSARTDWTFSAHNLLELLNRTESSFILFMPVLCIVKTNLSRENLYVKSPLTKRHECTSKTNLTGRQRVTYFGFELKRVYWLVLVHASIIACVRQDRVQTISS